MGSSKMELRQKYKQLRQSLAESELETRSLAIANNALKLPIWEKTYFHIFLSIQSQKEVDTELLLHILSGKDKEIVVSKSDFDTKKMTHFLLTENTKIKPNAYQIPEPVAGLEVPTEKIEVVFVPLLAYDKIGQRVGYGKGFYDLFLKECQPNTIKIGLSFFEPEELIKDTFDGDVKLDYCVSSNAVYSF